MTGTEIYKRTATYEKEAMTIRLHAPHWKLLLAFDGQRSLAEVALSAEIAFAEALPLTDKFLARDWIEEQPITLDQYLLRTGAANLSEIGAAVPPAIILHAPKRETDQQVTGLPGKTSGPAHGPMHLSRVVDFIVSQSENISLGRIMVYRVFLRVPHELLQEEDIVSVRLVNDPGLIRNETLQQAVASAVHEIVQQPLPDSVYAAA